MVISYCQYCQIVIKDYRSRTFCSNQCRVKDGIEKRTRNCTYCKTEFTLPKGESFKSNIAFCTRICWAQYQIGSNNPSWKGIKELRECLVCNIEFVIRNTNGKTKKFCSTTCRKLDTHARNLLTRICEHCDTTFQTKQKTVVNKYCSRACADKQHAIRMKGKYNSNYVHGEADAKYGFGFTIALRESIRVRDNHCCQVCNLSAEQHDTLLHVHHIDFDKHNHNEMNLVTLCNPCHFKLHGKNTREQCKEELLKLLEEKKKRQNMCIISE